jgi:A/G-specific adenine glycosylase
MPKFRANIFRSKLMGGQTMGLQQKPKTYDLCEFRKKLLLWYHHHARNLPWRDNPTPYRTWISEIMLQQTQSTTVVQYYESFLKRFPTVSSLARASEQEVLKFWSGLGYYSRVRNLLKSARQIVKEHKAFPNDFDTIVSLPGIGRYTAGAICSFAFNQAKPVVDGNIRRVIMRLQGLRKPPRESYFWNQMQAWIPDRESSSFNQAMMELGALVCIPSQPRCPKCPVRTFCKANMLGLQNNIPESGSKRKYERATVVALLLERSGRFLLTSHNTCSFIPGKWGLPSQLVSPMKSPEDMAHSLCRKIVSRKIHLQPCATFCHSITRYRIRVYGFYGSLTLSPSGLHGNDSYRWVRASGLNVLLTSSLFHKVIRGYDEWAKDAG